jgi:predicted O-methyltransferase YrrM
MEWLSSIETAKFCLEHMKDENNVYLAYYEPYDLLAFAARKADSGGGGLFLEFGVNTGGTINHIATTLSHRTIYGFDWFEGLPEDWRPEFKKGTFRRSPPAVRDNVQLVMGLFNQSLPGFLNDHQDNIAFMHVDCDLYSSTCDIFEHIYMRIVPGTILVFDEFFRYIGWQNGEYKAFNELVSKHNMTYKFLGYGFEQVAVEILTVGDKNYE